MCAYTVDGVWERDFSVRTEGLIRDGDSFSGKTRIRGVDFYRIGWMDGVYVLGRTLPLDKSSDGRKET